MFLLLCISIAHLYLVQKDLAICVIDQFMVSRQQTQLVGFLGSQEDAIMVVSSPKEGQPEICFCNEAAGKAFGTGQNV